MNSTFILNAIKAKYPDAAIVAELSIEDSEFYDPDPEAGPARPVAEHKYLRRIDALMWQSLTRTAIEIKVTKADFNRDTHWKRRAWQRVTHRFVYVVPHDLEVMSPHGCGLWKVDEFGRITVVKNAIISRTPEPLPQSVVQRLAYRAGARPEVTDGP